MDTGAECRNHRELVQQAQEILIQFRAFSVDEAHQYLYEVAQARKLLIAEVAGRIVAGEWTRTEISQEFTSADVSTWLGCW